VEKTKSNLRKRVREEHTPVPRIYNEALIELSIQEDRDSVAAKLHVPIFSSLKSSIYCSRRKRFPPLPKTREEIEVDDEFTYSLSLCTIQLSFPFSSTQFHDFYVLKVKLPSFKLELQLISPDPITVGRRGAQT
jgi:hypothetical protein